ncbi:probable oligoribonuclease isoform X1 [Diadema setosum]
MFLSKLRHIFRPQYSKNFFCQRGITCAAAAMSNNHHHHHHHHNQPAGRRGGRPKKIEEMKSRLVWVDLEMTGLDVNTCHIIEMACLITDQDLNVVAEGPNLIVHQPEDVLSSMNDWCVQHHTDSGLVDAVRASKTTLQQAEYEMLAFVREHTYPKLCPLAGNSIHADKAFLVKYMPQFMDHLHYRIVDVSTVKELCRRWYPEEYAAGYQKKASHRALDDIKESIEELKYYRQAIFK